MTTKIRNQKITQADLIKPNAFRNWIKNNLEHLYVRKNIPNDHLLIYLDYVKGVIGKSKDVDVPTWMDLIRKIESEIKSIKKVEE